jgi:hypothetical protein
MPIPARRLASVMCALLLPACNGGQSDDTGTTGTPNTSSGPAISSTTGDDPTSTSTSTTAPTTTLPDATDTTSDPPTDPSTTTTTPTTTSTTDTDAPGCPLDAGPGVTELALTPALFGGGDDPADAPVCAIKNPERGFHGYTDLRDLTDDDLDDVAADGWTVIYGQVLIPEYRDDPLDALVLDQVDDAFNRVRAHGMKVVPRFHYSDGIGDPDATLDRILGHIDQLAPLLQAHADVILTLHAGFIGAYGEWHSSENGLDAPGPRKQIMDALLAALPNDRTISVRRPSFKSDAYAGPLTDATAFDGSALARVGHVNDCFLASDDDEGTYQEPGEKDYAIADSNYVPVGGETCGVNPPRSECPAALDELALHHWTHLNSAYHPDVLSGWRDDGCFDEIACRLGYRLALTALRFADAASPGGAVPVALDLYNDGFAAPTNPRPLRLVFDGPTRFEAPAEFDLRAALPGETVKLCVDAAVPQDAPPGAYRLGVRMPDAADTLEGDERQAIRLAQDIEWSGGVNWFDATVEIQ